MQKGAVFSIGGFLCVWVLLDGCVWKEKRGADSSPLDTSSKYAPDFREKNVNYPPTQVDECRKRQSG